MAHDVNCTWNDREKEQLRNVSWGKITVEITESIFSSKSKIAYQSILLKQVLKE